MKLAEKVLVEEQNARIRRALTTSRCGGPAKDPNGAWKLRPKTVYEAHKAKEAVEKRTLVKKQVVLGKEFQGRAFLASPSSVVFKDFEVGKPETRKFTLTNVSWTFNTFKLLNLNLEIADFFEISYTRPGQMSAGTTCEVTVLFTPKVNDDIHDEIPFLASTGPFSVPLVALSKRVAVTVAPNILHFGGVVLAESSTRTVTITNDGALPTKCDLGGSLLQALDGPLSIKPAKFTNVHIGPFSKVTFNLTFAPLELCHVEETLEIHFHDKSSDNVVVPVVGDGVAVPVYVDERSTTIDLQCCYLGILYRDELVVHNRGKTSMKVTPSVPPPLQPYLEYVPKFGFLQPADSLSFQVKFRPSAAMLSQAAQFIVDGVLTAKLRIHVNGQALPVYFTLKATLTSPDLTITTPDEGRVHFGPVTVGEGVCLDVAVTNPALLPVDVGFVHLPREISVKDGFTTLLPQSTHTFTVSFRPSQPGPYRKTIVLKTQRNTEYMVEVTGIGKTAPLRFSEPRVLLPATTVGDTSHATVVLYNPTRAVQCYEFCSLPPGLSVSPSGGEIPPGGKEPLMVESRFLRENDTADHPPDEPWSFHRTSQLACGIRGYELEVIHLEVSECFVMPIVTAEVDVRSKEKRASEIPQPNPHLNPAAFLDWYQSHALHHLYFGAVPAKTTSSRTVILHNFGMVPADLRVKPLDPFGPFRVTRPPTALQSGNICEMEVVFSPPAPAAYSEELVVEVSSAGPPSRVTIPLRGSGLTPTLTAAVEPCSARDALFGYPSHEPHDFGVVLGSSLTVPEIRRGGGNVMAEVRSREVVLQNTSEFAVRFSFAIEEAYPLNSTGLHPFTLTPTHGTIEKGSSVRVTCHFLPDRESPLYRAVAVCCYGEQCTISFALFGSAWAHSAYLRAPACLPLSHAVRVGGDGAITGRISSTLFPFPPPSAPPAVRMLEFVPRLASDNRVIEDAVHTVCLGNVRQGTVEVTFNAKEVADAERVGFRLHGVSGGKVMVPGGLGEIKVDIVCSPKDSTGYLLPSLFQQLPVQGVVISVQAPLTVTVKPPGGEGYTVPLVLKGSIHLPTIGSD